MKKLVICGGATGSGAYSIRTAHLRQGLPPQLSEEIGDVRNHSSGTVTQRLDISPDGTKIVSTTAIPNNPEAMAYYSPPTEDQTFPQVHAHSVSFGGTVYCCATSNAFRAYGGSSPFLYVFSWDSNVIQSVPTTGLGTVRFLAFSPDGSYLAVAHDTTPFLRIYRTSDWSYVNAATAFLNNATDLCWSADSTKVVVASSVNSVGSLSVYSPTGTRLHAAPTETAYGSLAMWALTKKNAVVFSTPGIGSNAANRLRELDLGSYTVTPLVDFAPAVTSFAIDESTNIAYMYHAAFEGRYFSQADLGTGAVMKSTPSLQAVISASGAPTFKILRRDTGRVSGTVRDISNLPAKRTILAYERVSGRLAGKTTSDPLTGNYSLELPNTREHDLVFQAAPGEQLNDLFFARVEPQAA